MTSVLDEDSRFLIVIVAVRRHEPRQPQGVQGQPRSSRQVQGTIPELSIRCIDNIGWRRRHLIWCRRPRLEHELDAFDRVVVIVGLQANHGAMHVDPAVRNEAATIALVVARRRLIGTADVVHDAISFEEP